MKAKVVFLMLLLVLFTVFVYQNASENVGVIFFFWSIILPKIVLLVITLALGVIIGLIIATMINRKQVKKKREKEEAEKERLTNKPGKIETEKKDKEINNRM